MSGQALEFKQLNIRAWEAFEKGQDIHLQAAPSQAELLYRNFKIIKEKLKSQTKNAIMEKYGNAATQEELPKELLLGQTERQVEYDRAGRIIEGQETSLPKSKYEEDVYINNHTSVWGSWWKDHQWGYKCCKQTIRNSYCTGAAGIEAAEAAADLMKILLLQQRRKGLLLGELTYLMTWSWTRKNLLRPLKRRMKERGRRKMKGSASIMLDGVMRSLLRR